MRRAALTLTALLLAGAALAQAAPPPGVAATPATPAATPAVAPAGATAPDGVATKGVATKGVAAGPGGIVCGEPYVIRRGDTLQRLAVKVYGPEATYHALWAANRRRLGLRDPSLIEIGQTIVAPCPISVSAALEAQAAAEAAQPSADVPATEAAADTDAATPQAAPRPAPTLTVMRLPGSPLAQAVALRALGETLGAGGFVIGDADGAAAGGGGLRFPLPRPDCAAGAAAANETLADETLADGALADETRRPCDALAWSAPLLEQALVWHARADAGPLTTRAALAGLRVCRADSAPRAALAIPPGAQVQDGGAASACLAAVAEGRADVAVSEAAAADAALRDPALDAAVAEQPALTTLVTLAAAAPKDDPLARAALAALELGLARMRASGAWFAQVDAALSLR